MRALGLLGLLAVACAASPARADESAALPVHPVLRAETDLRFLSSDTEGYNGFEVRRLWLGLWAAPTPWLYAIGTINAVSGEKPEIVDAYAIVLPHPDVRISFGYQRTPLFATARTELEWTLPIPELSMPVTALWPGRDTGVEVHYLPAHFPMEGWLRVGNGTGSATGNNNNHFAVDARLDAVAGRARVGASREEFAGLRFGVGIHGHDNYEQGGITGQTVDGFVYYRAPIVSNGRTITEAHLLGFLGPTKLTVEGGFALEDRVTQPGSLTATPVFLDPVAAFGGSAELAWMITGQHRISGASAIAYTPYHSFDIARTGLEIAARLERLSLGRETRDVTPGGATGAAAALTWWAASYLSWALAGYHYTYDAPPLESPGRTSSWIVLSRVTVALNWPGLSSERDVQASTDNR